MSFRTTLESIIAPTPLSFLAFRISPGFLKSILFPIPAYLVKWGKKSGPFQIPCEFLGLHLRPTRRNIAKDDFTRGFYCIQTNPHTCWSSFCHHFWLNILHINTCFVTFWCLFYHIDRHSIAGMVIF